MHDAIGHTQSFRDLLDPARAAALHATLSLAGHSPKHGDPLPPFWHQIYFWDAQPPAKLGPDGHPSVGSGLIPDLGLPVRMWAGGTLAFDAPVVLGKPAEKHSTVENVVQKVGRTGPLGFVTLRHEIWQENQLCVTEHQDLVYRMLQTDTNQPVPKQAPTDERTACKTSFNSTQLFRYSALTFNGHRIHYDLEYARQTERYSGLVVHGPLLAQQLILLAQEKLGGLSTFAFRATSPLIHDEEAELCWNDGRLWVRGPSGRLCMEATAT